MKTENRERVLVGVHWDNRSPRRWEPAFSFPTQVTDETVRWSNYSCAINRRFGVCDTVLSEPDGAGSDLRWCGKGECQALPSDREGSGLALLDLRPG